MEPIKPILSDDVVKRIEERLSKKYERDIEINLKKDKGFWYNVQALTLEIEYITNEELKNIAKDDELLDKVKEFDEKLSEHIKELKRIRRENRKK